MKTLYLVACVSMKQTCPAPAQDLYISPWFRMAKTLVKQEKVDWFILSAKHGLVAPSTVIGPYNIALSHMAAQERREWAEKVCGQLEAANYFADCVIVLAGENYRRGLLPWLETRYSHVQVPMRGLAIGEQLSWLKTQIS